jgi:hypothetical protein
VKQFTRWLPTNELLHLLDKPAGVVELTLRYQLC